MANSFKLLSDEVKPRERILADGHARSLAVYELLAVLLKTGTPGCDVLELARRLISAFGSVGELVKVDGAQFQSVISRWNLVHPEKRIAGIGKAKIAELLAMFELVRRGVSSKPERIEMLEDAAELFFAELGQGERQECALILPLDVANRPLRNPEVMTRGLIDFTPLDVREVFSRALKWGASSVLVAHNHPSGDVEPSDEDINVTRRLIDASKLIGIELQDHLILGNAPEFSSLREMGVFS